MPGAIAQHINEASVGRGSRLAQSVRLAEWQDRMADCRPSTTSHVATSHTIQKTAPGSLERPSLGHNEHDTFGMLDMHTPRFGCGDGWWLSFISTDAGNSLVSLEALEIGY